MKKALWDARAATYLSPTFMDAVELRDQLLGVQIYQGEFGSMRLLMRRLIENDK